VFNQNNPKLSRNEGTIEYCRLHNITLQAWSPVASGKLTGGGNTDGEHVQNTAELVAEMAQEKGVSPDAILIAWILRHPARIQPLPGTTKPDRILAACEGEDVTLTREEWYRLFTAGRGENLP
jgi:predicted oxidoreductase